MIVLSEEQQQIISTIRRFVEREVKPVASEMEHRDEYPHALVERMKELGLFGAIIPTEYGTTFAKGVQGRAAPWRSDTLRSQFLDTCRAFRQCPEKKEDSHGNDSRIQIRRRPGAYQSSGD